jgi:putative tryptophan/tyrosine transport system substrate-binding protein
MPTIGILWGGGESDVSRFREAFSNLGSDITIREQYARGNAGEFPRLARELVNIPVDVIVASATPAALAARDATEGNNIPVVFAAVGAPRLVAATNVTGVSLAEPDASGKRLEALKNTIPGLKHVAALSNGTNPVHQAYLGKMVGVTDFKVRDSNTLDDALKELRQEHDALVVLPDLMFHTYRSMIIGFAAMNRLPVIYSQRSYVAEGGLMSYGPNYTDMFRQAATLVEKILNGTNPGNLDPEPVKSSELVIKRSTADALGVKIPGGATVID